MPDTQSRPPDNTDGISQWRGETCRYGKPLRPVSSEEMERQLTPLDDFRKASLPPRKRGAFFLPFTIGICGLAVLVESTCHLLAMIYAEIGRAHV